ncbi:Integral membrane protein [Rasamsonia emersonii CBS 393.64]|uniref:Integral membrane protein n=1 Tax=Rasamsonia emersonii (strain ATCC 16479 / CBS 393.64 / IMI 116815) TaxID=1408163 RepID=A0A0F4YKS6_RASE3|nr:Integral membrane protein [Rasamsonia emersonii CBS 393.64]KKA18705.1 Integral membrane protein [Rasamsonia emersonii CBS 393.64]
MGLIRPAQIIISAPPLNLRYAEPQAVPRTPAEETPLVKSINLPTPAINPVATSYAMDPDGTPPSDQQPPVFNYVLSFILVGLAWGFTTPFIRRAAVEFNARQEEAARKQQTQMQSTGESYRDDDDDSGDDNDNNNERARVGRRHTTTPAARPSQSPSPSPSQSFLLAKLTSLFWTVINLLRTPGYAIPLVLNLTGSNSPSQSPSPTRWLSFSLSSASVTEWIDRLIRAADARSDYL